MINLTLSLIPGTFNPLHKGHLAIENYCKNKKEYPMFLISVYPFDKENVPSFVERALQFHGIYPYLGVESKSIGGQIKEVVGTYVQLYKFYPSKMIVNIGMDTMARVNDLKYYDNNTVFQEFCNLLSDFNVLLRAFPRNGVKKIELRKELVIHTEFVSSFEEIAISSTELRNVHNSDDKR